MELFAKTIISILLLQYVTSDEMKCIAHSFTHFTAEQLADLGSDLTMESSNLEFDELILHGQTDSITQLMVTRIMAIKASKTKHKLLLIIGSTQAHAEHYKNLCSKTKYQQVHFLIGKDFPNLDMIRAGRLYVEYMTGPERCSSEFTGRLEERTISIANGIAFHDEKSFSLVMFDTQRNPSGIHGLTPRHYIFIGSNSASSTYGCGRSYPYSPENLEKYIKFLDTNVHYNLVITPGTKESEDYLDLEFDEPIMIVSSYNIKGSRKYFQSKVKSIKIFYEHLETAKSMEMDFNFEDYENNWNQLNTNDFLSTNYRIVKDFLSINYGYHLVTSLSTYSHREVLWVDSAKGLPSCGFFHCFYIQYVRINNNENVSTKTTQDALQMANAMINTMNEQMKILATMFANSKQSESKTKQPEQDDGKTEL
jgi:hypothetical protein